MKDIAKEVALQLLHLEAVKLRPDEPFTWASGWKSPIYCDNRVVLSDPMARTLIKQHLSGLVMDYFPDTTAICGVATGAIAQGVLVADLMKLPFSYVRPKPKDHGMGNQIEGRLFPDDKVVVVEDLISTGGSSLKAVEALRAYGCEVLGMVAIYTHGLDKAVEAFEAAGVELHTLSNYDKVIEMAVELRYISSDDLEVLREWRKDPANWKNNL